MLSLVLEVWRFCWSLIICIWVGSFCRNVLCFMWFVDVVRVGDGCLDWLGIDEEEFLDMC